MLLTTEGTRSRTWSLKPAMLCSKMLLKILGGGGGGVKLTQGGDGGSQNGIIVETPPKQKPSNIVNKTPI